MTDTEDFATIRITWDAADSEIVQAASMMAFYAATLPLVTGDQAELDGFRL